MRKTADGEQASVTVDVKPDKPAAKPAQTVARQPAAQGKPEAPKPADSVPTESADAEGSAKKSGLPFGISARIDAAMQLLSNDPIAFARCMLGHTGWLGRRLLRSVRVSGLDIFRTVTADEASTTAELFGAEMALANNLLALVQQYIRVQSDRLWLEPDFTGERAGERPAPLCCSGSSSGCCTVCGRTRSCSPLQRHKRFLFSIKGGTYNG